MKDQFEFQQLRINALMTEIERLNMELLKVKNSALKTTLTDPNFDRKLSELNVNYEIIESELSKI